VSAAAIIRKAHDAGLNLRVSESGSLKVSGPRDAIERMKPELAANKAVILAELRPRSAATDSALEERKAMAMGGVPERYLDGWARLQCQRPAGVTESRWRQTIEDAGCFLDNWGQLAATFGWAPDDLFAAPDNRGRRGLAWWLNGRNVTALGPEHACAGEPAYDRLTHTDWRNPYHEAH
jgi:hypothetical protein